MNRANRRDPAARTLMSAAWVRIAAVVCCLMWASGSSGVLPAVVAFLGAFDSTHQVLVVGDRAGTTVVFHHHTKEAEAPERHTLLMQAFTAVATTSGESNDHVMGFSNAVACKAGSVRVEVEATAPPCEETFLSLNDIAFDKPWEGASNLPYLRIPPLSCARGSRGTQLRI